jgi:hypothetical protein
MGQVQDGGLSNPDDVSIHKQVKEIADSLSPELVRLHKAPMESTADIPLYEKCIEQMEVIKREVANHDSLFAFHNSISHMQKAIKLAQAQAENQKILWNLQEVSAILFKIQSLPS